MLAPSRTLVTQSLIDLVMSVKSTGKVTDLEDVSEESIQVIPEFVEHLYCTTRYPIANLKLYS